MKDWQAELLAVYAAISHKLINHVSFAVNNMSDERGAEELEAMKELQSQLTRDFG